MTKVTWQVLRKVFPAAEGAFLTSLGVFPHQDFEANHNAIRKPAPGFNPILHTGGRELMETRGAQTRLSKPLLPERIGGKMA